MSHSVCDKCGAPITFITSDGIVKPLHPGGGWTCSAPAKVSIERKPVQPTHCPKCNAAVYFIRHNGGSVWLDDLGWPWPLHPCMNQQLFITSYADVLKVPQSKFGKDAHFGVIVLEAHDKPGATELAIQTGEKTAVGVLVAGSHYGVLGTIVAIVPQGETHVVKGMAFKNTPSVVKWLY